MESAPRAPPKIKYISNCTRGVLDICWKSHIDSFVSWQWFYYSNRQNQNDPKRMQLRRRRDTDLDEFNSYYNAQAPTRVLIHGWQSSPKSNTIQDIKDAYLKREDCNIIGMNIRNSIVCLTLIYVVLVCMNVTAVDWSSLASNAYYATPAKQTKDVGQYTAEMIDYLCQQRGASTNSFHIVGHSLGESWFSEEWLIEWIHCCDSRSDVTNDRIFCHKHRKNWYCLKFAFKTFDSRCQGSTKISWVSVTKAICHKMHLSHRQSCLNVTSISIAFDVIKSIYYEHFVTKYSKVCDRFLSFVTIISLVKHQCKNFETKFRRRNCDKEVPTYSCLLQVLIHLDMREHTPKAEEYPE